MPEPGTITWISIFGAAVSGGLVANLIDHIITWIKTHRKDIKSARDVVDAHLDPLLKAADEISGKIVSLAGKDFLPLAAQNETDSEQTFNSELVGLTYLYAKFWGRIEILEKESLGLSIASDPRGKTLAKFLSCLGSQQIRLTNRTHQKAIGEVATAVLSSGHLRTIGVVEFGSKLTIEESARLWCAPLTQLLKSSGTRTARQQLLVYGVVLHALVDTLDPKHHSSHERPSYSNKLSQESKRRIEHLVFGTYLKESDATNRYTADQ